jgi:hypothetical protein
MKLGLLTRTPDARRAGDCSHPLPKLPGWRLTVPAGLFLGWNTPAPERPIRPLGLTQFLQGSLHRPPFVPGATPSEARRVLCAAFPSTSVASRLMEEFDV